MDAVQLLKDDHDVVKRILNDLDSTTERGVKTRQELFAKVRQELEVHEAIEEEIFYPALKEHPKAKELVLEAYEEHHVVDTVMAEIAVVPFEDETWGAKLTVMKENVEHHIEEEEGEMFKQARQVFSTEELKELGDRMRARKDELLTQSRQMSA
jgi:hemerythrin-like domain-containing protein